jgi:hypothetical protein
MRGLHNIRRLDKVMMLSRMARDVTMALRNRLMKRVDFGIKVREIPNSDLNMNDSILHNCWQQAHMIIQCTFRRRLRELMSKRKIDMIYVHNLMRFYPIYVTQNHDRYAEYKYIQDD